MAAWRVRWRNALGALSIAVAFDLCVFMFPPADSPKAADLVVILGPWQQHSRVATGAELAHRFPGTDLLISVYDLRECPLLRRMTQVPDAFCFVPNPFTTRGEARAAADFARAHNDRSMTVVTTGDQLVRAGVRFKRCFDGPVRLAEADATLEFRFARLAYQNAAMVKALVLERSC